MFACALAASFLAGAVARAAEGIPAGTKDAANSSASSRSSGPAPAAAARKEGHASGSLVLPEITVERERQTALAVQSMNISGTPDAGPLNRHFAAIVGIGALYHPRYPGSDQMKVSPYPYVDVQGLLGGRMYLSDLNGIGFYLLDKQPFRVGIGINKSSSRKSSKDLYLRGLPDIGQTAQVKGFVAYTFNRFAIEATVARRLGSEPATSAQIAFGAAAAPTPKLHLTATVSVGWADAAYQRLFFGISPQASLDAARAGNPLPVYVPRSGLASAQLVFSAVYQFGVHWGLVGRVGLSDLVGSQAKDSPLTRNSFGKSVAVGLAYMF
jgi:outer membrane scaffolding protein for murein synthesis (MipA/OmpV family)